MTDITPGSYWTHKLKGYEIQVQPAGGRTKDADAATWQPAITYLRTDEEDGEPYILTRSAFLAKFEAVPLRDEGDV
jgi:hypothetical protein